VEELCAVTRIFLPLLMCKIDAQACLHDAMIALVPAVDALMRTMRGYILLRVKTL
jgi:hypothetical protein